jgi:hypothetical protein
MDQVPLRRRPSESAARRRALLRGADVVSITSSDSALPGNYVYDLETDRFLRISDDTSSWVTDGPTPACQFLWHTPVNGGHGSTQHLGELLN